jgi:hypothetical protein
LYGGDVPTREDHHHECGADGQRRNESRSGADAGRTDGQDQEKRPNELCHVFIHDV